MNQLLSHNFSLTCCEFQVESKFPTLQEGPQIQKWIGELLGIFLAGSEKKGVLSVVWYKDVGVRDGDEDIFSVDNSNELWNDCVVVFLVGAWVQISLPVSF